MGIEGRITGGRNNADLRSKKGDEILRGVTYQKAEDSCTGKASLSNTRTGRKSGNWGGKKKGHRLIKGKTWEEKRVHPRAVGAEGWQVRSNQGKRGEWGKCGWGKKSSRRKDSFFRRLVCGVKKPYGFEKGKRGGRASTWGGWGGGGGDN